MVEDERDLKEKAEERIGWGEGGRRYGAGVGGKRPRPIQSLNMLSLHGYTRKRV